MRLALMMLLTAVTVFTLAALSRAPYTPPGSSDARLRFSWRMNVAAHETCRARTQAELDALPVHMRTPEVCTSDVANYTLIVRIDRSAADTIQLIRGGMKGDRPLFVLEDRTLAPGHHHVHVKLERRTGSGKQVLASLDTTLRVRSGTIQLVTLDRHSRSLIARSAAESHRH